ncbi:MAG: IS4 family transposase [Methylococcaceae bacterium NSP1-2]|nr:MAG: IS4 family transposase [Methylococcaceae bacterium NSP1-2]
MALRLVDECDVVQDMTDGISGLLIGDKGYIRPLLTEELKWQDIDLQTPLRKNRNDSRPKAFVKQLLSIRRLVETVIGQLSERFHIEKHESVTFGILPIVLFVSCLLILLAYF